LNELTAGSLCSGYGGLEAAVRLAREGAATRVRWHAARKEPGVEPRPKRVTPPEHLRTCRWCPYALHAVLVRGGQPDAWIAFYCERCDNRDRGR
jgi:hypothetical protein